MKRLRVLLGDDHSIVHAGVRSLIEPEWELIGPVGDGVSLVEAALDLRPDVIILDIGMPVLNGIQAAERIRQSWPEAKLLFLTMHTNLVYLREAMRVGGSGYVLKTSATKELKAAITSVLRGELFVSAALGPAVQEMLWNSSGRRLTRAAGISGRQRHILQLIAEGHTTKHIASLLNISTKTVEWHRGELMRKTGLGTTAQLVAFAVSEGLTGGSMPDKDE